MAEEKSEGLEAEELEEQDAEELPDRDAMSVVDAGNSLGPPDVTP